MKFKGNDLYMVRGDNAVMSVTMEDNGTSRAFVSGETATLSVRTAMPPESQALGDLKFQTTATIDEESGAAIINIIPTKTAYLRFGYGEYVYDIQANLVGEGLTTITPESAFVVVREVT